VQITIATEEQEEPVTEQRDERHEVTSGHNVVDPTADTQSVITDEPLLFILAVDQRSSLERDLYGLTTATSEASARISEDKLLVYQALLDAVPDLPPGVQPGILIDEQYGASVAELASRSGGVINLSMPIEASGQEWFEFAYGEDWTRHAEYFATDHAKVLVRDNPDFDPDRRAEQAGRLSEVSRWAAANARALIVELLVPAADDENRTTGGGSQFDDNQRPADTVAAMEYLQDHGVEPAIWKVEGLDEHDAAVSIVATARREGRKARCILLGRHAPHDAVDRWIRVAAPIPGFTGFAIGRTIWWDALHSHLHHRATAKETRRRIRVSYLEFVNYYVNARDGGVTDPLGPEYW
jgi:myo-inositol catabolism protein IolC